MLLHEDYPHSIPARAWLRWKENYFWVCMDPERDLCCLAHSTMEPTFERAFAQVAHEWLDAATLTRRLDTDGPLAREYLRIDLVDTLHVAVSPAELGSGSRLWESPDELNDRFHHDVVPSPGGAVTHHLFWRR